VLVVDNIASHFLTVDYLCMELSLMRWHSAVKIHVVLGQGACLIKASKLNHSSRNDLVLLDTEDGLLLQFLDSIDDPKSHAHW
jgi:hypothetical protein